MPRSNDVEVGEKPATTSTVPVVGIGASAGGLTALESFLPGIKKGAGLAFVVVQHRSRHESLLADLLERYRRSGLEPIAHETPVEANHIYVIRQRRPTRRTPAFGATGGAARRAPRRSTASFISLARARGARGAGVLLSGTGSGGTLGLRAIKEAGGLTIAQEGCSTTAGAQRGHRRGRLRAAGRRHRPSSSSISATSTRSREVEDGPPSVPDADLRTAATRNPRLQRLQGPHGGTRAARMQVLLIDEVPKFIERLRSSRPRSTRCCRTC